LLDEKSSKLMSNYCLKQNTMLLHPTYVGFVWVNEMTGGPYMLLVQGPGGYDRPVYTWYGDWGIVRGRYSMAASTVEPRAVGGRLQVGRNCPFLAYINMTIEYMHSAVADGFPRLSDPIEVKVTHVM